MTTNKTPQIIDSHLYESLVKENRVLREKLRAVSAVGVSVMFHTHREDCSHFTRDFLKAVVSIAHELKMQEIQDIYQDGYEMASDPGVLDRLHSSRFEE